MVIFEVIFDYLSNLKTGKMILWCYLIWYIVIVAFYFDPDPRIWINSIGICIVIGVALILSVSGNPRSSLEKWQVFRLFAMPFCVSSFSSLIKDNGFILVIPPHQNEQLTVMGACILFVLVVYCIKWLKNKDLTL